MKGRRPGFGEVLGVGEFRALWAAELLSILGDQLARVALAVLVFQQTSSAALSALTYALTFAPAVLGGALLSGLADRYPRRTVLVATDLLRASLAAVMVIPSLPLPALWALVGVLSMASAPFKAAQLALLPQILTGDRYVVGLSLRQITGQSAQLVGFASGGLLLAVVEPHLALAMNAATFLASAVLIVRGVRPRAAAIHAARSEASGVVLTGNRHLLPVVAVVSLAGLFVVPEGIAAPYGSAINAGVAGIGLLMAADPVGSVIGAWLVARMRIRPSRQSVVLLAAGAGIPLVLCAPGPGLIISIALWAVSGVLSTAYLIQTQAIVVDLVPDHRRGRVMGRIATCLYTAQGLAIVTGGVAAQATGPFHAVAGAGLLGIVLALCVGVWWRRVARSRRDLAAGSEPDSQPTMSHQMSLFVITGTSSQINRHPQLSSSGTRPDQMSLLAMAGTSSGTGRQDEHDVDGTGPNQMSLFVTTDTSSQTNRQPEHGSTGTKPDQMSLLATTDTSSRAGGQNDPLMRLLPAETVVARGRRRGTQTPSLWGWPLRPIPGRPVGRRMAIA